MKAHLILRSKEITTGDHYLSDKEVMEILDRGAAEDGMGLWSVVHSMVMDAVQDSANGHPGAKKGHGWANDGDGFYIYNGELDCNRMASIIAKGVEGWILRQAEKTEAELALDALRNQR